MTTFILTAERTVTMDQRAVLAMDLASADDYPGVHAIPEDAWAQTALRHVTGANIRSVIEYDDPQGRFEFVTGATVLPRADTITDAQGVTIDMRGAN